MNYINSTCLLYLQNVQLFGRHDMLYLTIIYMSEVLEYEDVILSGVDSFVICTGHKKRKSENILSK